MLLELESEVARTEKMTKIACCRGMTQPDDRGQILDWRLSREKAKSRNVDLEEHRDKMNCENVLRTEKWSLVNWTKRCYQTGQTEM